MIRPCATCATPINDRTTARYTIKGKPEWYCTRPCAEKGRK